MPAAVETYGGCESAVPAKTYLPLKLRLAIPSICCDMPWTSVASAARSCCDMVPLAPSTPTEMACCNAVTAEFSCESAVCSSAEMLAMLRRNWSQSPDCDDTATSRAADDGSSEAAFTRLPVVSCSTAVCSAWSAALSALSTVCVV